MSDNLDQISLQIGRIQSTLEEGTRQREALFRKLDLLGDNMSEVKGAVRSVSERHDALKSKVDAQVMPAIEDMKAMKSRGLGIMAGVALAAGGASAGVTKLVAK